ncbi:MAG TPA: hypothetical protein VFI73_00805 [Candidatus Nitrosopolaris sp.]|nr:hypothetical protein [Candidatus Nitrosopolaris sp.]
MASVNTNEDVETVAKKAVEALYGTNIKDFKVRVIFPFPSEHKRDSWDVQVIFLSNGVQYTVDLMIDEKNGQVTNARLIDKMTPV